MTGPETAAAAGAALVLDALLGDPDRMPHPVVLMGKCITVLERRLRRALPATPRGELLGGAALAAVMLGGTAAISLFCLWLAGALSPWLRAGLEVFWGWQCLAMRGLAAEGARVESALREGTLPEARRAVARIVGRDTEVLDRAGVARAAVESVAENFSDGVMAPLFFFLIGGAPLALCYKAVNTMDSMVGYRNERYLYFGRVPARLDDGANFLPARLSALLLIAAAPLCGENARLAFTVWRRDRRRHPSPNAGQTEAAMAGALGIFLGGPTSYFGVMKDKPVLGAGLGPAAPDHIRRAVLMMKAGTLVGFLLLAALRLVL